MIWESRKKNYNRVDIDMICNNCNRDLPDVSFQRRRDIRGEHPYRKICKGCYAERYAETIRANYQRNRERLLQERGGVEVKRGRPRKQT